METVARMTLEGIAAEIGISRTTIYKVMKDKGNVSEKTRATVMEAVYHRLCVIPVKKRQLFFPGGEKGNRRGTRGVRGRRFTYFNCGGIIGGAMAAA